MLRNLKVVLLFFCIPLLPAFFLQSQVTSYVHEGDKLAEKYAITAKAALGLPNVLWLDSRKKGKYDAGHVEGAFWVSYKDWEGSLMTIFENFEPGQNIVVYCNPTCSTSRNLAKQLRQEMGQENIFYLTGGFDAWSNLQK